MFKSKKSLSVILASSILFAACGNNASDEGKKSDEGTKSESGKKEVVTIKAQTAGAETTRVENLEAAAQSLNKELEKEGENIEVKVETNVFDGSWNDYLKQFTLAFQANKAPDIFAIGHEYVGVLSDGGYIQNLSKIKQSETYKTVYPALWDSVSYKGEVWGIPQDNDARPVFYNKGILKKLGWSQDKIDKLPEEVKEGNYTLDDMTKTAKEAVDKKLVANGIIHRPVAGTDFHALAYNFGGKLYDEKEDKIILDKKAVKKQLAYYEGLAKDKLLPSNLTTMEWPSVHKMVVNEETLFYYGGVWNVFNWSDEAFHNKLGKVDPKWTKEHFGMMLIPAAEKGGKPLTLSHPFAYTVSSKTKNPELVQRLLEHVDTDLQTKHNVETMHLPISEDAANNEKYKKDITLDDVSYMNEYTTSVPNHKSFNSYSDTIFAAIQAVESGSKNSDEALKDVEAQLKNDMGEDLIIKE